MYSRRLSSVLTIAIAVLASARLAQAQIISYETATLSGLNENPPLISTGSGQFQIHLESDAAQYELIYNNLGTPVTQVHIHLGNPGTNGGVIAFLCANMGAPTMATTPCPSPGTSVSGTLMAAEVLEVTDPDGRVLLGAMDFEGFKQAVVGGATYVNVHTEAQPSGELRGQINERAR